LSYPIVVSLAYFVHGRLVFVGSVLSVAGIARFHVVYIAQMIVGASTLIVAPAVLSSRW
jgi:hypothetical protein